MKHYRTALLGLTIVGCMSGNSGGGCNGGHLTLSSVCPAPSGPTHGIRADGRVDVSAQEAWPNRPIEPPAPIAAEVGVACAAFAACTDSVQNISNCLAGRLELIGTNTAERAIPLSGKNERWDFFIRAVLYSKGDCETINRILTPRSHTISCQEDGCCQTEGTPPDVSCEGDIAVFSSGDQHLRDCSRSYTRCSTESPTGCTDRPFVSCTSPAKDRCDGNIKLGCDGSGSVSFNDCSWDGGTCVESPDGAKCVPPGAPNACANMKATCDGTKLPLCVFGQPTVVDCAAAGIGSCVDTPVPEDAGLTLCKPNVWPCGFSQCVTAGADGG